MTDLSRTFLPQTRHVKHQGKDNVTNVIEHRSTISPSQQHSIRNKWPLTQVPIVLDLNDILALQIAHSSGDVSGEEFKREL